MTQHTPGPWMIVAAGDIVRAEPHGKFVAWTRSDPSKETLDGYFATDMAENTKANARLIAAAPELLEALHQLLSAGNNWKDYHEAANYSRAAIAKAETSN